MVTAAYLFLFLILLDLIRQNKIRKRNICKRMNDELPTDGLGFAAWWLAAAKEARASGLNQNAIIGLALVKSESAEEPLNAGKLLAYGEPFIFRQGKPFGL